MPESVVTRGFGPGATIALVVTAGYSVGASLASFYPDIDLSLEINRTVSFDESELT
jgi:hypothetical protein